MPVCGQISMRMDTIPIEEVVIKRKKEIGPSLGYKLVHFDSLTFAVNSLSDIGNLLSSSSSLFIKSYGPGGISTITFRGTNPCQTLITWNDININSPMPGQFDLSLVPAGFFDRISVHYGSGSMEISDGGFGGAINLETDPEWTKQTNFSINQSVGSFGRYTGMIKARIGNGQFSSVTKVFFHSAVNNFRYLDDYNSAEPVWQKRKNNEVLQKGLLQEIYFNGSKNLVSAKVWYQSASRNLPSPSITGQSSSGEKQYDESVRSVLNFRFLQSKYKLNLTAALTADKLNYQNQLASVDSRNKILTSLFKASAGTSLSDNIILRFTISEELNSVNSNNYDEKKIRNKVIGTFASYCDISERMNSHFIVRLIVLDDKFLSPDFSTGIEFKAAGNDALVFRANISKNSRAPALNDMYWIPGGNPDLKNETGYSGEVSISLAGQKNGNISTKTELTLFGNLIKDMIQWKPGNFSYWSAENIGKVNTGGLESTSGVKYSSGNISSSIEIGYTYTRAIDTQKNPVIESDIRPQLMYVPKNQLRTNIRFHYKELYSFLTTNYTSRRFISVDNSQYLKGYSISDFVLGYRIKFPKNALNLNLRVDNVFNVNYQVIAWYPMPGRSFHAGIEIQMFNRK